MKIGKQVKLERLYNSDKTNLNKSIDIQLMTKFKNKFRIIGFREVFNMTFNYYKINYDDR